MMTTTTVHVELVQHSDDDWSVLIDGTEQHIHGYGAFRRLLEQHPEAEYRLSGTQETALRKADIQRAMARFKANGGRGWTSGVE
jgi:hypothetical protein